MNQIYFTKTYYSQFQWNNSNYYLGAILPDYRNDFLEGIGHLSAESIRNRFLGGKKSFTDKELYEMTHIDGINHFALGVRNDHERGIAVARMVRNPSNPLSAEVAITIIDEYQNIGLGTLLFKLISLAAFERGIDQLVMHLLSQNERMQRLAKKVGKLASKISYGETVTYTIKLDEQEMIKIRKECEQLFTAIKKAR